MGWPADRLFNAFDELTSRYSDEDKRKLFSENAKRAYKVKN
jgi:predicted TIM-barrel fold metal-dependent hydrolase